ncbi:MAG: hypothetical protein AAF236_15770, partial [Verrucomicrobiota bacterium]
KHLPRLHPSYYSGRAYVHWIFTTKNRETGWLDSEFHQAFRESLIHRCFQEGLFCPIYTVMPDHLHVLLIGTEESGDQRLTIRRIRKDLGSKLKSRGAEWQKEAFDHVLRAEDRSRGAFRSVVGYIRENPVRKGMVQRPEEWEFSGSVLPRFPAVAIGHEKFWDIFWREVSASEDRAEDAAIPASVGSD